MRIDRSPVIEAESCRRYRDARRPGTRSRADRHDPRAGRANPVSPDARRAGRSGNFSTTSPEVSAGDPDRSGDMRVRAAGLYGARGRRVHARAAAWAWCGGPNRSAGPGPNAAGVANPV